MLSVHTIPAGRLLMIAFFFSKLITLIACSLQDSQNVFIQSSPPYTSCLFSIPSNVHTKDTEYPQGICSPTFVMDDYYSKLFLTSIYSF